MENHSKDSYIKGYNKTLHLLLHYIDIYFVFKF